MVARARAGTAFEKGQIPGVAHCAAFGIAIVSAAAANHPAPAVYARIGSAHRHLRAVVAVQVVGDELGVVGTGVNISSEADAPQKSPVEFVGVDVVGAVGNMKCI